MPPRTAKSSPGRAARYFRRAVILATATLIALVGVLGTGLPAQAKPSAAELKKEIAATNNQIEVYAEKYNGATVQLADDKKAQAKLAAEIGPLELQANVAGQQLGTLAAKLYMAGGQHQTLEALLDSSSTQSLLDALGALNEMARGRKATIDSASALVTQYTAEKKKQDALVIKDKALVASLAASKKQVEAHLSQLKILSAEATTTSSGGGGGGGGGSGGGGSNNVGSGPYTKGQVMPHPCPYASASGKAATAVHKACSLIWQSGKNPPWTMYKYATEGPDHYDCSGFTLTAWKAAGVSLKHYTGSQWTETAPPKGGSRPNRSTLKPGDLVFYYSDHHHVAIYIGNGWIAEAQETGQPLKEAPIGSPSGYGRP